MIIINILVLFVLSIYSYGVTVRYRKLWRMYMNLEKRYDFAVSSRGRMAMRLSEAGVSPGEGDASSRSERKRG